MRHERGVPAFTLARAYLRPLADTGFMANALTLALVYGAMYAYVGGAPFAVRELLGVSARMPGLIFGAFSPV